MALRGQYGIKRLTDLRNGFKHTAGFPSPQAVMDGRADTAHFFEENTPLVFGLAFEDIDLAGVVRHDATRARLKTAARFDAEGDRLAAMGTLAVAFEQLMTEQANDEDAPRGLSVYSFGERMPTAHALRTDQVHATLEQRITAPAAVCPYERRKHSPGSSRGHARSPGRCRRACA
ncbi:hypothetical protein ACFU5O_36470 [Streptomyces sp. NPDC057445]|uniref:hypothetical protein n=1 Tax=Streptomyces sp. NPDC057445 TaxID=3346136 RepID=UPI0036C9B7DE